MHAAGIICQIDTTGGRQGYILAQTCLSSEIAGPDTASSEVLGNLLAQLPFVLRPKQSCSVADLRKLFVIVAADPQRYERFARAALASAPPVGEAAARGWWKRMRRKGKLLSVARLAKASATFAGGADYIVWKINRHSGAGIELKPWQRRHPLLAAVTLLPRLLKSGAVR